MKKLPIVALCTICLLLISAQFSHAQRIRKAQTQLNTPSPAYVLFSGTIKGTIYLKKAAIPNNVSINKIVLGLKQGLKAVEFIPQNSGFYPNHSINVEKVKMLNNAATVSVKSNGDSYAIQYAITKLPIMKPLTVRLASNTLKSMYFSLEPLLKSFPVAYLTACDKTFECYNFRGGFIDPPK